MTWATSNRIVFKDTGITFCCRALRQRRVDLGQSDRAARYGRKRREIEDVRVALEAEMTASQGGRSSRRLTPIQPAPRVAR